MCVKKINGISLKIGCYTIEKHNKALVKVTVNCPHCGAINDAYKNSRTKCAYCKETFIIQ